MKVLISDKMDARCVEILEDNEGVTVEIKTDLTPQELIEVIDDYDALIVRSGTQVNEAVFKAASKLKVVGRAGAGVDNIDVNAATRGGVIVMNTPGGNSVSTAEHSFAMIMALARNIPQGSATLKNGLWERSKLTGVELRGKTLGILGLGKVGSEVALRANAFGMKVIAYDPMVSSEFAESYGVCLTEPKDIYAQSDFITVHLPLISQTRHMISDDQILSCKKGVFFVNCARGGILDELALLRHIETGHVAGAALDVFEQEPPVDNQLVVHERVVCTPHLGASTTEAQQSVALQVAKQVGDLLMGRVIRNAVNTPSVEPEIYAKMRPYLELAERLGSLQAQLIEGRMERVTIQYHGDVSYPTSIMTSAVLQGILSYVTDMPINAVNAPIFAQERGLCVDELRSNEHEDYASLITVICRTDKEERLIAGTLFGKSDPRIVRFDGYKFDASSAGHMLFYINEDIPGIIGHIGTIMGEHRINIAQMSCGRDEVGGSALTILNIDGPISEAMLNDVRSRDYISWAKFASI
ncbi:MAG: phosphoglycerate dehydrogenase [Candidatus Latescibacterota bacterium]|nr:phosphoglycerate dehydrogenase [Candidatus Latescibacterota bacterium]